MSYVHCHNCGWDNGDFESTKTKLRFLRWDLNDIVNPSYTKHVKYQHLVALKFIFKDSFGLLKSFFQKYKTFEEFEKRNPEKICPKCGLKRLDVD